MTDDLYSELTGKTKQLDWCIKELRKSGTAFAEAERAYNVSRREWCLRLKSQGMAIGLIERTYKGIPDVADALFAMRVAETTYKANQEAVMSLKLQLRLLDNQISREWSNPQADL